MVVSFTREYSGLALANKIFSAEDNERARPDDIKIRYMSYFFFLRKDIKERITMIIIEFIGSTIFVKNIEILISVVLSLRKNILPICWSR